MKPFLIPTLITPLSCRLQFLQHLKRRGVVVTLNMHPAAGTEAASINSEDATHLLDPSLQPAGIQYIEAQYQAAARALGFDTSSSLPIPYNLTDKTYAQVRILVSRSFEPSSCCV